MSNYILQLLVDISFSWIRMFIALGLSILLGLGIGIWAATSRRAEKIIIPIVDILQTLPILAFFPFVIYIIVAAIPGYIGINVAVIFLIITSMLWNIIFGVYESVKELPHEFIELTAIYGMGLKERLSKIYIPASMPKVMSQSTLSWAIGLFYLVTSEIFSTSSKTYMVKHGIGVALTQLALSGNFSEYLVGILIFIVFVILTRLLFFAPLERYFNKHNMSSIQKTHTTHFVHLIKSRLKLKVPKIKIPIKFALGKKHDTYSLSNEVVMRPKKRGYANLVYALLAILFVAIIVSNKTLFSYELSILVSFIASFARVWFAFAIILLISVPLSVYLIFFSKKLSAYILLFQIIASIPATIMLPLIVSFFVKMPFHSEAVALSVYLLSGIWYVIFSMLSQKAYIPQSIYEVKRLFGIKGLQAWKKIYIYAILPGLITGAVTGIAAEWNASIVAEYFTSTGIGNGAVLTSVSIGIGKLLDLSLDNGNMVLMLLALLNFTIMIVIINRLVWKRLFNRIEDIYK